MANLVKETVASGRLVGEAGQSSRAYKADLVFLASMRQRLVFGDSEVVEMGSGGGKEGVKTSGPPSKGKKGK